MKKTLERWSVNAFLEGMNAVTYYCDGRPLAGDARAEREDLSPMQHLLVGVAGCLALNCRTVLLKKQVKGVNLEVVVSAARSGGLDNRLSELVVTAIFRGALSHADAETILEEAKPLCTVANTFLSAPSMVYETRTIKQRLGLMNMQIVTRADAAGARRAALGSSCRGP